MSHPPINPETFPHGIICGCSCGCKRPLHDGNAMSEDVQPPELDWDGTLITPGISKSICAECFVGNHAASRPSSQRER